MSARFKLVLAIGALLVLLAGTAFAISSQRASDEDRLGGYLTTTANGAVFLQWTRTGSQLTGSAQIAALKQSGGADVRENNVPFRGVVSGKAITLDFSGLVKWNGQLVGDEVLLSFPDDDGSLQSARFHQASIADYQVAVVGLRDRADALNAANAEARRRAAEAEAERKRLEDEAKETAEAAILTAFRSTCAEHAGSLSSDRPDELGYDAPGPNSAGEFCVVVFAGQGSFQVPIKPSDGSFYTAAANENRDQCALDAEDARLNAQDGYPWKKQPEYHAKAGVCYRGERY